MNRILFVLVLVLAAMLLSACSAESTPPPTVYIDCGGDKLFVAQFEEYVLTGTHFEAVATNTCYARGGTIVLSNFSQVKVVFYTPYRFADGEKIVLPSKEEEDFMGSIIFRKE